MTGKWKQKLIHANLRVQMVVMKYDKVKLAVVSVCHRSPLSLIIMLKISLWHFTKSTPWSRKAILRFSWLNERKTPRLSLSPWNWSDTHLPSSQSCSLAETCQIMTALAVVPCHEQIHLCGAVCLTTPTSESPPKHICSRRMCSRYLFCI